MTEAMLDLEKIRADYQAARALCKRRLILCAGTGCVANGALKVHAALLEALEEAKLNVEVCLSSKDEDKEKDILVSKSGCQGFCQQGPLLDIVPDGILYTHVKPEDVPEIVERTLKNGEVVERLLYHTPKDDRACRGTARIPFYTLQHRQVLKRCGNTDPEDIREYIAGGGYEAAKKAYTEMTPEEICKVMEDSGLRGRGGGGFPTGRKWALTLKQKNDRKFVICNGDEGDPGAFMDRSLLEGAPHAVIEGMMIAAEAVGASEAYVYVRMEYPLAVERIKKAAADARALGILGDDIFGTGRSLEFHVMEGAGAFVCGEETALIASIEGNRGMPHPKPPFPAESGLWGCPTVINNVETLATVPGILADNAKTFKAEGTASSPGTKTFALTGHVANTGLIEVPFGATLRKIIFDIGGGVTDKTGAVSNEAFKAVQIGGPSGACLTEEHLDLPLDFDSLRRIGAMVGSGGLVVMNRSTCMVQVARFFMQFTQNESCGKCVPCREGTRQMLALLDDIAEGRATEETLEVLEQTAHAVQKGSLCGLGKTAPNPVLATLRYFRQEVEAHVLEKRCPAGECKNLKFPEILADKCRGCTLCAKKCPTGAISGEKKQVHYIDPEKCIRCGACADVCKFGAVA
jgi:NADH-quinone oxidoreductase subunit F